MTTTDAIITAVRNAAERLDAIRVGAVRIEWNDSKIWIKTADESFAPIARPQK